MVVEPELGILKLLNHAIADKDATSSGWKVRGTWLLRWAPMPSLLKGSLLIGWFYNQQRRIGHGPETDPQLDMAKDMAKKAMNGIKDLVNGLVAGAMLTVLHAWSFLTASVRVRSAGAQPQRIKTM